MDWHVGPDGAPARVDDSGWLHFHERPAHLEPATPAERAAMSSEVAAFRTCEYCRTTYRNAHDALECERAAERVFFPDGGGAHDVQ